MSYTANIRKVNCVEYFDDPLTSDIKALDNSISELEYLSGEELISWRGEYGDDIELCYTKFINSFEKYKEEIENKEYLEILENIYSKVKGNESCIELDAIKIDWF